MTLDDPIDQALKEIQRDKEDLKRLKQRYKGYDFVKVDNFKRDDPAVLGGIQAVTLSDFDKTILSVVNGLPDAELTSRQVVDSMREAGLKLPEKDDAAMNAVGASLITLLKTGRILRTHEGRGRDPHRYTAMPQEAEKEAIPEEITS